MTTKSTTAEDRLGKLGIHLADAPTHFGVYVPPEHLSSVPAYR